MESSFVLRRQVAFHETDMAGIAHFSNFFRWMEEAEHAFLRSLALPPVEKEKATFKGWPRVRASCDYHAPLRFEDAFEICLFVKAVKLRSVVYFFRFWHVGASAEATAVARGEMTSAYAFFDVDAGSMKAVALEENLKSRVAAADSEAMRRQRPSG